MLISDIVKTKNDLIDLTFDDRTFWTKDDLFTELIYNYGDRVFYERTNTPAVEFKAILTNWWNRRGYHFNRLFDAWELEYNPIENTDRYETITDTTAGNGTSNTGTNVSTTANGTVTNSDKSVTDADSTASGTTKSNSYNASESEIAKQSDTGTNDVTVTNTGTTTNAMTNTGTTTTANVNTSNSVFEHSAHIHGNIGTMTSAQLLAGEKSVRMTMLYQDLLREFIDLYTSY